MKSQASEALNPERLQSQNRLRQKFESPIKPLGVLHGRLERDEFTFGHILRLRSSLRTRRM